MVFSSLVLLSRDGKRAPQFSLYLGLWASRSLLAGDDPQRYTPLYLVNPVGGSLLALRAAPSGSLDFPWHAWGYACVFSVALAGIGLLMFQRSSGT